MPPCKTREVPKEVLRLNEEFKILFPEKLPNELPPCRVTDHRIDVIECAKVPAQRIYRIAPSEDVDFQNS